MASCMHACIRHIIAAAHHSQSPCLSIRCPADDYYSSVQQCGPGYCVYGDCINDTCICFENTDGIYCEIVTGLYFTHNRCNMPASTPIQLLWMTHTPLPIPAPPLMLFFFLHCAAPLSPPRDFTFEPVNFTLSWQPPQSYETLQIQSALWYYILLEDKDRGMQLSRTTDLTSFMLEDLVPDTQYCVSIRTVASGGFGVYSERNCFNSSVAGKWHYLN